jgi:uncharacterized membrane protein
VSGEASDQPTSIDEQPVAVDETIVASPTDKAATEEEADAEDEMDSDDGRWSSRLRRIVRKPVPSGTSSITGFLGDDPRWGVLGVAITGFAMLWYFLHFAHLSTDIHRGYGDSAFDIGLYDQGVWLLSRFHAPYVTLMGRNLFGDHTQFSLLAIVPLYWIHAGADTLLYVQALMMALGAVPVYMLVMRRMNNPAFATVLAISFLLHPALAQTNLENYHPDSFLIPIMGFVLYAAIENKPRMLIVFSVLALLCKEDVVLILLPVLIWFAWRRNLRLGIVLALGSIATAGLMTYVVMRSLTGVPTLNAWRIPYGGVIGFIKETFRKPADVAKYLIKGDSPNGRPFYVWQMIAPTGLMFLIAPEIAATVILVLIGNVVSTFGYQHQIAYHYSMVILPGLAMGTAYAISRLKKSKWRAVAVTIVGVSSLWSAFLWGPFPFSVDNQVPHWSPKDPAVTAIEQVRKKVPPNAVIATYYSFAPHLTHRERIYMWPTPFHASNWNTFKQEGECLPIANDVQYLMLPPNLGDNANVLNAIQSQFQVVAKSSNAVLYKRVPGSSTDICTAVRNGTAAAAS